MSELTKEKRYVVSKLHREQSGLNKQTMEIIGVPLLESMQEYQEGNYEKAVDLLYPVRYEMWRLGGSEAQVNLIKSYSNLRQQRIQKFNSWGGGGSKKR